MDIKVLIATHKKYWLPQNDLYMPVHVGSALSDLKMNIQRDDDGENISKKNPHYCELTAIYWAWKNLEADYIGLVHYRRYFADRMPGIFAGNDRRRFIMTRPVAERILKQVDVIVPKKRNYYIETLYSHYEHTHEGEHLRQTREILKAKCPEYLAEFDKMLYRKSAHMFNMFIMKQDVFRAYCTWLFPILEELEGCVDISSMTPYEARYMGRISELLLDVWLDTQKIQYKEVPYIQLGKTNWPKKITTFLAAKYKNEKYRQSF